MSDRQRKLLDITAALVLGGVLIWAFLSLFQGQIAFDVFSNNPESFSNYLSNLGAWSYIAYVGAVVLEGLVAFIPGWFIYPVGGVLFGFWPTVGLVLIGNFIAASVSFWIGQRWGYTLLRKFISKEHLESWENFMTSKGAWSVFLLKLNPLTSLDVWNYLAGASPISYKKFSIANILGITPLVMLSAFLGEETFTAAPQIFGILILLTLLYIAWFIVSLPHKITKKKNKTS